MQLIYRAANYEYNPYNTYKTEGNRIGIYRGVKTNFRLHTVVRLHQSPRLLKYRGITYVS
ncbi:DUF4278 domain-containing protein [Fischerella sp. JS2]|uniref:DUF4278 domain-containing protein n=1 Tax=Fischerella sp. JS2 TaxID=2597771 RepID=UPI0028E37101|nr:DUF4278 domain-containing protein [Fischerella sp. JS2]